MLISKFHRVIRNRVVWAGFAVAASLALLGFIGPSYSCRRSREQAEPDAEGKLFGEAVSERQFYLARFFEMGMNERNSPQTEDEQRALRLRTWKRLAALKMAERFRLEASDAEVGQVIRMDPSFAVNGAFDAQRYRAVVQSQLRLDVGTFETFVRQSLTLRKLVDMLRAAVWTAPAELQQRLSGLTDALSVQYIFLPRDEQLDRADVSELEAKRFFEQHREIFAEPDRVSVLYAAFPITGYLAAAQVGEEEIARYYDEHVGGFSRTDTNSADVVAAQPLEEVRETIRSNLLWKAASLKAKDAATDFAVTLAPERDAETPDFRETAAALGLAVATTRPFAASEPVPDLDVGPDFNRAAFNLDPADPISAVSDAVGGTNHFYVLAPCAQIPARTPDFEEVREKVESLARTAAEHEAFRERAESTREKLAEQLKAGARFEQAAEGLGLNVSTTATFSVYDSVATNDFPYLQELTPSLLWMRAGDLSKPAWVADGAVLAHLSARTPGAPTTVQMLAPELLTTLQRYRAALVFDDWCEHLLVEGSFQDLRPPRAASEDETEEDEEADDAAEAPDPNDKVPFQELL